MSKISRFAGIFLMFLLSGFICPRMETVFWGKSSTCAAEISSIQRAENASVLELSAGAVQVVPRTEKIVEPESGIPGTERKGWKLTWNARESSYVEYAFRKPIKLPPFSLAKVRARIYAQPGCAAKHMNVRFRDCDGEIMQFRSEFNLLRGGFFDLEWLVRPEDVNGSWGSEKLNRRIDMPAMLHSLTLSYSENVPLGSLWLLDLSVETKMKVPEKQNGEVPQTVTAFRPICSMTDADWFLKHWGNCDFSAQDGFLYFQNLRSPTGIREKKFDITRYEKKPSQIVFDTELLAGNASLTVFWGYADKAEAEEYPKVFKTEAAEIPKGRQKMVLDLSETLKEAEFPVRLYRLDICPTVPEKAQKEPVELKIHGIGIAEEQTLAEAVDFDVQTDTNVRVLSVGKEDSLRFLFTNRSEKDGNFTIQMEYENFFGGKKNEVISLFLKAGECRSVQPRWRPDSLGHWNIRAKIQSEEEPETEAEKSRSLAWFEPSRSRKTLQSGFLFSVCTHTERWSEADRRLEVESSALCGVKVVRLGGGWAKFEPEKGKWNWESTDKIVDAYLENGIETQMTLSSPPSWAVSEEIRNDKTRKPWKNCPENLEDWKNYVRETGKHFKGRIRFYENWNEPDLTGFSEMTLPQYVSLQKAVFEAMKEVDPAANVMSGGFATLSRHHGLIYPEFQQDFLLNAKGAFEIHAIHEHGWFDGYRKRIDELFLPLREETETAVPWYANETAMTSVGGFENRQAETLFKKLLFSWVRGSIGYTWYDLRNDGFDPRYGEHHFGMVTNDFYPKPVYSVYRMLTANYSSMKEAKDLSPDENASIYHFTDGKDILLPVWLNSSFEESRHFVVRTDAESAKIIDLMGNETPLKIQNSHLLLELGKVPQTLKLCGASSAEVLGELLEVETHSELVPGRRFRFSLKAFNPLPREAEFTVELLSAVPELKFKALKQRVSIPAQKQTVLTFEAEVRDDFRSFSILPIQYRLEGSEWSGLLFAPLQPAFWFPREFAPQADYVLGRADQITPMTPADPFNAHRLWKGKEDLSADVWFAGTRKALEFRVKVQDDVRTLPEGTLSDAAGDQLRVQIWSEEKLKFQEFVFAKMATGELKVLKADGSGNFREMEPEKFVLTVKEEEGQTIYQARIPWKILGMEAEALHESGIRLNAAVGDDDGEGMDSWIHWGEKLPKEETGKSAWRFLLKQR